MASPVTCHRGVSAVTDEDSGGTSPRRAARLDHAQSALCGLPPAPFASFEICEREVAPASVASTVKAVGCELCCTIGPAHAGTTFRKGMRTKLFDISRLCNDYQETLRWDGEREKPDV